MEGARAHRYNEKGVLNQHIYILGSPRTGSTLLYQLVCKFSDGLYITNECEGPIAEYFKEKHQAVIDNKPNITLKSAYGKTTGTLSPSEGSTYFKQWFGGGHPSETVASDFLPDQQDDFIKQHEGVEKLGYFLVNKNAWNCFRIPTLVKIGIPSLFIWIRRDITDASLSDLDARYYWGDPNGWNSASPAHYYDIRKKHYTEQVVEQQHYFNQAIERDLKQSGAHYLELWYEELCESPSYWVKRITGNLVEVSLKQKHEHLFLKQNDIDRVTEYAKKYESYYRDHIL